MSELQLDIVTPDKKLVSEVVNYVSCPGVAGEFGVLKDHVALLSALKVGALRYDKDGKQQYVFIAGGFADVSNNVVTILADAAELAEDIDTERAKAAQKRAEERLAKRDEIDAVRAEASLQRALVRLNVAGR